MAGKTIAEKALSRNSTSGESVAGGDLVDARVDGLLAINYLHVGGTYRQMGFPDGPPTVFDPERVYLMDDHVQPPRSVEVARANRESAGVAARLRLGHYRSEMGIGHQIMLESGYVRPGELVVGNDSHTIAYGAVNAVSTGVGTDEAAYVWAFGDLYFTVPETIKVTLRGERRPYPFAKDVILYLAGRYGDSFAQDHAIEFDGPFCHALDMSSRVTIADHAVEVGATFGIFPFDETTERFVAASGGDGRSYEPLEADPGAVYATQVEVDCDSVDFQVAKPFRFDNVVPVGEVAGRRIDQARIGSCANGRFEDIEIAARMLRGRRVAPHVRFYVSPASLAVYRQCAQAGLIGDLLEAGVQVDSPGCAICQSPGIVLNEEVCISSTTRNYHGRFGGATCADAEVYLAGPATVTAAAIAGEIVDPRDYLGG